MKRQVKKAHCAGWTRKNRLTRLRGLFFLAGQHSYQSIDRPQEAFTGIGNPIGGQSIAQLDLLEEFLFKEEAQVSLSLCVAHIGGIHDLRFPGTVFTGAQNIRDDLYIRSAFADRGLNASFFKPGIFGIDADIHTDSF